jgi:hypothetical protein
MDELRLSRIHEAGHAVGRVLMAEQMGVEPLEAVHSIEMDGEPTTFGPKFSKVLDELGAKDLSPAMWRAAVERAQPDDVLAWVTAKIFVAVCGSVAEARYRRVAFETVWAAPSTAADVRDCFRDGELAGYGEERIQGLIAEQAELATNSIEQAWPAVLALAKRLVARQTDGAKAVRIILQALASTDHRSRGGA